LPPKSRNLRAVNGKQASAPRATVAQTIVKGDEIFRLVAEGHTVTEAGKLMTPPMSEQQASRLWNAAVERHTQSDTAFRQAVIERELETLRLVKLYMMPHVRSGDPAAARVVIQATKQVADMMGLNAALKVQISNQRVDETVGELTELIEGHEDQIPRLLESGVLIMGTFADDEDTAAG
jgi:hypothetical protein